MERLLQMMMKAICFNQKKRDNTWHPKSIQRHTHTPLCYITNAKHGLKTKKSGDSGFFSAILTNDDAFRRDSDYLRVEIGFLKIKYKNFFIQSNNLCTVQVDIIVQII